MGAILQESYRILRPLAEGGCGEVYLAAHTRLPARFAIKVLHRGLARDSEALSRFRQEAEITATLRHPHIVQVFDFNVTEAGSPYLVMELLEGQLLSQRLAAAGALDPPSAIGIVKQIALALHAAHARGIVHRDLKPDNVMLLAVDGVPDFVKVLDFGISQASWRPRLTDGAQVAGTPQYMAPEQASGLREQIDHRTDQFSLAAIAYTLLTGREPFRGDDAIGVVYQVVHADPPLPSQLVPALGANVDAVIMRGLSKQPLERYPDVLVFAAALRAALDEPPLMAGDASSEPPPVRALAIETPPQPALVGDGDLDAATMPVGRVTVRLIRRMRWRLHRLPRRIAMLALAAAAFAWFSPTTRGPTRAAWHRAEARVGEALGDAAAALRGSRSEKDDR